MHRGTKLLSLEPESCSPRAKSRTNGTLHMCLLQEGTVLVMVQEFAEGGDLYSFLQKHLGCLTEELAVDVVLRPLLRALTYCHAHGICHRGGLGESGDFTVMV